MWPSLGRQLEQLQEGLFSLDQELSSDQQLDWTPALDQMKVLPFAELE